MAAVALYFNDGGTLTVQNSTISGNSDPWGWSGAIFNDGTLTVQDSTFSGNSAPDGAGGAIYNSGPLTVQDSTFSGNAALYDGTIYNSYSTMNLSNTIIANTTSGSDCVNDGSIGVNDHNLIGDGSCSPALSGDPKLGPLADNGGTTQTMALLPGSPAIDAGNDATCLATDQRGITRPQGAHCDIGAY